MEKLKGPHIYTNDGVFDKINKLVSDGVDKLQLVIDFDSTITKQHENGVLSPNCIELFMHKCKQLPISATEKIMALRSKYGSIELNPTLSLERKVDAMIELFTTFHEGLQGFELDRKEIVQVVEKYGTPFRDNTTELFAKLKNLNIPVTIFSAGLGDVIKVYLQQEQVLYDNVNVLANFLKFNGSLVDGLDTYGNFIHPFNKHEHFGRYKCSNITENRNNIILIGDNIADVTTVNGLEDEGTILKIGFFYNETDDGLDIFKETFDIVLKDDQTMNVILDIVKLFE